MTIKDSIYKRIDVSSGGSLIAEIDTKALLDVCDCDKAWNFGNSCKYPDKYRDGGRD